MGAGGALMKGLLLCFGSKAGPKTLNMVLVAMVKGRDVEGGCYLSGKVLLGMDSWGMGGELCPWTAFTLDTC